MLRVKVFRWMIFGWFLLMGSVLHAVPAATILSVHGDVKIRRGLEEKWQTAVSGMSLDEIDTILSLEGKAVLSVHDSLTFSLGSHSILDIGDLRTITKRELFIFLMSEKVKNLEQREGTQLRVGNVSVVHGESKAKKEAEFVSSNLQNMRREVNGAQALFDNRYYSNTIVKLVKIEKRYEEKEDCGEIHFLMARSFEHLDEPGQAVDSYRLVLTQTSACTDAGSEYRKRESDRAIERLKK
jgi:hypothetical protein